MEHSTIRSEGTEAAVIGAGIGGLAVAIALARPGWSRPSTRRAEELRPLGAGLSIWPNGVARAARARARRAGRAAPRTGGALRRADGSVLAEFDPEAIAERYGAPLVGLHRADLHEALIGALGARAAPDSAARLSDIEDGELRFADGTQPEPT